MSINLNIPGFNPNTLSMMNPVSGLTSSLGSVVNTAQSGVMQTLSQLFGALSQMFSMGGNGQFQANPNSLNIGNSLGQGQFMGNQAFNMGNSFGQPQLGSGFGQPQQLGNGFGQSQQPINITVNMGQPQLQGSQSRDVGHCGSAQSSGSAQPMSTGNAAQILNQNFDKLSGGAETFTRDDLSRIANDPSKSSELRQAAQFVLDNPGSMTKLDNADARFRGKNEATDGRISKGDLTAASTMSDWQ